MMLKLSPTMEGWVTKASFPRLKLFANQMLTSAREDWPTADHMNFLLAYKTQYNSTDYRQLLLDGSSQDIIAHKWFLFISRIQV